MFRFYFIFIFIITIIIFLCFFWISVNEFYKWNRFLNFFVFACFCSYGSFFGPSQPVIAQRVIQESKSLLENPHLASRVSKSHHGVSTVSLSFLIFYSLYASNLIFVMFVYWGVCLTFDGTTSWALIQVICCVHLTSYVILTYLG